MKKRKFNIIVLFLILTILPSCGRDRRTYVNNRLKTNSETITCSKGNNIHNIDIQNNLEQKEIDLLTPIIANVLHDKILNRIGYITSYNYQTKNPNWVAWHLTDKHTDGPYTRKGVPYYHEDGSVYGIGIVTPETCRNGYIVDMDAKEPRQELSDWTRDYNMSHGHMCPAADNKWDKAAMNQSFLLTNMCPQDEKLNNGGWKKLEEKCRYWANKYGDIYIVAGPIFNYPINRFLGNNRLAVPDAFFKVILCLQGSPKGIGFIYKNDSSHQSMKANVYSIDEVEEITGFDFFSSLDDNIENVIEANSDIDLWR